MPRLRTTVSQFALVSGRRRNHTETIACRVPSRRRPGAREAAHLYLMVEHAAADGQEHELCQIVMREAQAAFVEQEGVGAALALSRAVAGVNRVMWEETRRLPVHRRLPLGLLAVVLDHDDAYICQLATGQLFLGRAGHSCGVPTLGYWRELHAGGAPAMPTLGQTADLTAEIIHVRLEPGDWLALCATNLARLIEPDTLRALAGQPVEDLIGRLCQVAEDYGLAHTSGLALAIAETPNPSPQPGPLTLRLMEPAVMPVAAATTTSGSRLSQMLRWPSRPASASTPLPGPAPLAAPVTVAAPVATSIVDEITAPIPVFGQPEPLPDNIVRLYTTPPLAPAAQPEPGVERAPSVTPAPVTSPSPAPARSRARLTTQSARSARARWLDALAASMVMATDAMRGDARPVTAGVPGGAERPVSRPAARRRSPSMTARPLFRGEDGGPASGGIASLAGAGAAVLPRVAALTWPRPTTPVAVLLAVVTAAVVLASVASAVTPSWSVPSFGGQAAPPPVVTQAREQREAAMTASPEQARQTLEQVQETLAVAQAATTTRPENVAQIAAERAATVAALDALNRVTRVGAPAVLADLSASGAPATTPKQLVVGGGKLYVLDPYTSTLYLVDAEGKEPTALLAKGWNVSRQKVSDLVGIAWRGDTLMAVDRGRVYTLDGPNGSWRTTPLAGGTIGLGAHAVTAFNGGLYVLDNTSRQVLKFAQGAFGQSPTSWLKQAGAADLSSAVDIAIDGRIYALTAAGQIHVMSGGKVEKTLPIAVSPGPRNPTALVTSADSNFLYVAEAEGRILKLTKDGMLVRQYMLADGDATLKGLSALVVDEERQTFHAVAGNQVLRLTLARPAPPSTITMRME